jgi:hypothetical protein
MFISLYFYCFFACNKSYLDQPAFECDAWSKSLGYGCEHYPSFRVKEDKCWTGVLSSQYQGISVALGSQPSVSRNKCWLGVLNPQCQGIIATYALIGSVWYRSVFH